jgi:hypothetical protein
VVPPNADEPGAKGARFDTGVGAGVMVAVGSWPEEDATRLVCVAVAQASLYWPSSTSTARTALLEAQVTNPAPSSPSWVTVVMAAAATADTTPMDAAAATSAGRNIGDMLAHDG